MSRAKLPSAGRLDATQYGLLTQACRTAKEIPRPRLLRRVIPVTVVGRGRSVIAGTLSTQLTPDIVR